MKPAYERENLILTEFDTEDVIVTSGPDPVIPIEPLNKITENRYVSFGSIDQVPGSWY